MVTVVMALVGAGLAVTMFLDFPAPPVPNPFEGWDGCLWIAGVGGCFF